MLIQNDSIQSEEMPEALLLDTVIESDAIVLKQGWKPDPMKSVWLASM